MKRFVILLSILILNLQFVSRVAATDLNDCSQNPIPQGINLNDCIGILQQKVNDLADQKNTLQSQINQFNAQIQLTQIKITDAQNTINQLEKEINTLGFRITYINDSVSNLEKLLKERIVATYQQSFVSNLEIMLTSNDFSDLILRLQYIKQVQENDKKILANLQSTKANYADQKDQREIKQAAIEDEKKKLEDLQTNLNQQKTAKDQLLAQTQGSEDTYQKLLAAAQAQLAALSNFATSRAGGSEIINHQDLSDSWGKYYNQRDSNWGNNNIGLSQEKIWEVGCLLTSYAMVSTHYGSNQTPADVAGNSSNFWANTAYFLQPGPSANGHSAQYITNPSKDSLKNDLNSGKVIIAGLSSNGGPFPAHYSDHWVVLRSVDGDSFKINDPWYVGAINVSMNDHYSGWTIIEARVYQ